MINERGTTNTGEQVAVAALLLAELDDKARMLVPPSDHHTGDANAFVQAVKTAAAIPGSPLVCFGGAPIARS